MYKLPSPDLSVSAEVAAIATQFYTGSPICPEPTVVVGSLTLVKGTDYTVAYENNTGSATEPTTVARVIITGMGDFRGTKTVTFNICHFQDFVTVDDIADQQYAGLVEIRPTVSAYGPGGTPLVEGPTGDFTTSYSNNTHPGLATVTLNGIHSGQSWTVTKQFAIRCNLATYGLFTSIPDQAYAGSAVTPVPGMVLADGFQLVADTDFSVTGYSNNTSVGTGTVTVAGAGYYYGSASTTFLIRYDATAYFSVDPLGAQLYSLDAELPKPLVTVRGLNGATLVLNQDYVLGYTYVAPGTSIVGSVTVVVTGIGSYMGSVSSNAAPLYRNIEQAYVDPEIDDQMYSGSEVRPDFTLKILVPSEIDEDGTIKKTVVRTLVKDTDYTIQSWTDNVSGGVGKANVVGVTVNGFGGAKQVTFNIVYSAPATYFNVGAISDQTMTGPSPVTPVPSVTCSNGLAIVKDTDYTLSYADNEGPGTGTCTVTGIGAYSRLASVTVGFTITSQFSVADIADQEYGGGTPVCPALTITGWDGTAMTESDDYVATYTSNLDVGTARVDIAGVKNGVAWTAEKTFRIKCSMTNSSLKVDSIPDQVAESSASVLTPDFMVKLVNGRVLELDTDYTIAWSNNTGPGEATATLTGKGLFYGTTANPFTIRTSLPTHAVVSAISDQSLGWGTFGDASGLRVLIVSSTTRKVTVDGKERSLSAFQGGLNVNVLSPAVTVTNEGTVLRSGADYSVRYDRTAPVVYVITGETEASDRVMEADVGAILAEAEGIGLYIDSAYSNTAKVRASIACAYIRLGKYSPVYSGIPVKPDVDMWIFMSTSSVPTGVAPSIEELDEGWYLGLSSDGKKFYKYDSAGQQQGELDITGKTFVWDFNSVVAYVKNSGDTWSRTGQCYQYRMKPTEYSIAFSGNDASGTATVTAYGTNGFAGSVSRTFQILHPFTVADLQDYQYTGDPIEPDPVVKFTDPDTGAAGTESPVKGTDYTVSYSGEHTEPGTYSAVITPVGNYSYASAMTRQFNIVANTFEANLDTTVYEYTGSEIKPDPVVKDSSTGNVLVKGTDYTVTYGDSCVDVGEHSLTVTGVGLYEFGTPQSILFNIATRTGTMTATYPSSFYSSSIFTFSEEHLKVYDTSGIPLVSGTEYTQSGLPRTVIDGSGEPGARSGIVITVTGVGSYADQECTLQSTVYWS